MEVEVDAGVEDKEGGRDEEEDERLSARTRQ